MTAAGSFWAMKHGDKHRRLGSDDPRSKPTILMES